MILTEISGTVGTQIEAPLWVTIAQWAGAISLLAGCTFTLIAAIGLFRFRGLFARMHAATKPQMLGLMLICIGITLTMRTWYWFLLCTLMVAIQMVAAPVGSHLMGRTAYRTGVGEPSPLIVDELAEDAATSRHSADQREPGVTHESSSQ